MDCHVFRRLCDELAPALMGCRIEKIHRPAKDVTLFTLYGTGGKRFLFIRAGRKAPFLFLSTHKIPVGSAPPADIMRLRKYLADRRIIDVLPDWAGRRLFLRVNADADRVQATRDDPRKTRFGDFLRRSSIDELPQVINVLQGDMSIVGPRPHMLQHTEQYSKLINKYMVRHLIKPGITGWAQVTGYRGETHSLSQMEGRVRRDIWYLENWSLLLDIRIIFMTVWNALRQDEHAY